MAEVLPLRIQTTVADVDYLVNRNPFSLPEFQRGEVWDTKKKSALIVSLLEGYGMPPLVVIKGEKEKIKHLLDGLQRFTALKKFLNDDYKLKLPDDINIKPELRAKIEGKKFSELPDDLKASLQQAKILIMEYEVPKELESDFLDIALELFKRLNRNPTPLKTGHLLYILTYIPDITPMIANKIKEISPKEDKDRAIFRAIARYLTLIENYDLFKAKKVNYPSGKYYSFVKTNLIWLKNDYLSKPPKEKEAILKEIKKLLDDFEKMHIESFDYLIEVFARRLKETELPKLMKEYIEKHDNDKEFKKFIKKLKNPPTEEEEVRKLFMKELEKEAKRSAENKIMTKARKYAESYSIYKKVWVGDVFAVLREKARELGYRSVEKFMQQVGNEAFLELIENPDFRTFVQDKKRDNRIWEFIEYGEKAIEQIIQKRKEQNKIEKTAKKKLDKALEEAETELEKQTNNSPSEKEKELELDVDLEDSLKPKEIVEKKLKQRKFKI